MAKTGWYSKWQKPVREGWYERDYTGVFEVVGQPNVHLDLWLQKSPGLGYWYVDDPKGQINDAYFEDLPWRGLSSNVELTGLRRPYGEGPVERHVRRHGDENDETLD